ncbi:MAG: DGQHR domain-containing protein [Peptococcaceae bacterium]
MKVPAIRAKIGIWVYYVATLTFKQIADNVKRVDDELHKSEVLQDMLQRSITDNYKRIAEYIHQQEERFFNSLVLAVYDGDPQWHEVRLDYGDGEEFYDLGILELTGNEKIFPVDGQHRVEGIKKVLEDSDKFNQEKIPVIFIGHKKDAEGMQRARRMFSTLNRYAKPVSMRDIIALDEDDVIAIVSRELIDNHALFSQRRILDSKTKAIPDSNTMALTSIITFYECNRELLWMMIKDKEIKDPEDKNVKGRSKIKQYVRLRPSDTEISEFTQICFSYWNSFMNDIKEVNDYAKQPKPNTNPFRNKSGGSLLFRPVSLLPFVKASIRIKEYYKTEFSEVFKNMSRLPLQLNSRIWKNVLWNQDRKTMIMNNQSIVELVLLYLYDKNILKDTEIRKLINELKIIKQLNDEHDVLELLDDLN